MTTIAYLGLGANLGQAELTVRQAIESFKKHPSIQNVQVASLYKTHPVDADGENYCNTVVAIETTLSPQALLILCQSIENAFHRTRSYRNAPRTLDIDILLYGVHCIEEDDLVIPHPRLTDRAFVLVPLLELNPHIEIPKAGPALVFLKKLHFSAKEAGLPSFCAPPLPENEHGTTPANPSLFQYIEKISPL